MRRFRRGLTALIGLGIGIGLSGCGSFDPSDWFNSKKPLPGERHLVFPEGVPGVPQGVPKELVKGNTPSTTDTAALIGVGSEPAVAAKPEPAPGSDKLVGKPKPWTGPTRSRGAQRVASRPKTTKPPKQAKVPSPAEPAAAGAAPPTRITIAPTRPATQANGKSGTLPSGQSPADSAIWGQTPAQSATTTASGSNAPWPAAKPQPMSNAPWPASPPPNQFSR